MTSPWRKQQAAATRRQIALAARRRFSADGYAATTIDAIAAEAGVAPATVYKVFGTKRAMAGELLSLVDEMAGIEGFRQSLATAQDPRALLATAVEIGRNIFEHSGDIIAAVRGAAEVEPEFASVFAEGRRRHVAGTGTIADRLVAMGALREGIDASWAAGTISLFADHETFEKLTRLFGWSLDECQERLTAQLCELLLGPRRRRSPTTKARN
ncbi:MAG TPA: TetR/AcrR family transcriptional regulator [Actinomycetota bacterium]|nr:TetR/AcrR family transcriptional regulator [Actinomycetota bacterium]